MKTLKDIMQKINEQGGGTHPFLQESLMRWAEEVEADLKKTDCPHCEGAGEIESPDHWNGKLITCPVCRGVGKR